MTGYESLLLEGKKLGFQEGKIENSIEVAIKLLQTDMSPDMIANISAVNEATLDLLQVNITHKFGNKTFQNLLAKHLIQIYPFLSNDIIEKFTRLSMEEIHNLRS